MKMRSLVPVLCLLLPWFRPGKAEEAPETLVVRPGKSLDLIPAEPGNRIEVSLGNGVLQPLQGSLKAPDSGDHWLAIASSDDAGNLSPVRWVWLRVDPDPPLVQLRVQPEPVPGEQGVLWVPAGTKAVASAEDPVAGVARLSLEAGGPLIASEAAEQTAELPGQGKVLVQAQATDRVENVSKPQTLQVSVDPQPPTGELTLEGPQIRNEAGLIAAPSVRAIATLKDADSGLDRWAAGLDGQEVKPEERWVPPWTPGKHSIEALAFDKVQNQSTIGPLEFTIDAEAPAIRWEIRQPGIPDGNGLNFHRSPVLIDAQAQDVAAGVARLEWSENGMDWKSASTGIRSSKTEVLLRATDRVENTGETKAAWRLDDEPPAIEIDSSLQGSVGPNNTVVLTAGQTVKVAATDSGCGVEQVRYSVDGGDWQVMPNGFRFPVVGRYTLRAQATDRLGNIENSTWSVWVRKPGVSP